MGWTERDVGDDGLAQFDAGGIRLALYPLGLLRDAAPDSELPPEGGWNGVTLAIKVADSEAVDSSTATAVASGARIVAAPVDREWGG